MNVVFKDAKSFIDAVAAKLDDCAAVSDSAVANSLSRLFYTLAGAASSRAEAIQARRDGYVIRAQGCERHAESLLEAARASVDWNQEVTDELYARW